MDSQTSEQAQELGQEYCFNILGYLFGQRQKDHSAQCSIASIAEALNYDEPSTGVIVEDLMDSNLIEADESNAAVSLTSLGLDVITRYRKNFNRPPAPATTHDVREQSMVVSSSPDAVDILLPETHSVVSVTFPAVADALRNAAPNLSLSAEQLAELEADIHTIEIQLTSPRPKTQVLVQCYRAIELVLNEVDDKDSVNELIRSVTSLMA